MANAGGNQHVGSRSSNASAPQYQTAAGGGIGDDASRGEAASLLPPPQVPGLRWSGLERGAGDGIGGASGQAVYGGQGPVQQGYTFEGAGVYAQSHSPYLNTRNQYGPNAPHVGYSKQSSYTQTQTHGMARQYHTLQTQMHPQAFMQNQGSAQAQYPAQYTQAQVNLPQGQLWAQTQRSNAHAVPSSSLAHSVSSQWAPMLVGG